MKYAVILVLIVLLGGGAVLFLAQGDSNEDDSSEENPAETTQTSPVNPDGNQQVVDFAVGMSNFEYDITQISAAPGDTVKVRVYTTEGSHDFVLDEFNVKSSVLTAGNEEIIEIEVSEDAEPGTYEFYCSVGNHRQLGMVGEFVVEEI